ncbi:amino acid dehydrogenase [Hoeflea sp. WL0058]|uniref:Amino acid dehydrogenase n=2 Tax=Flavimaribacter sediminis TaxID=2865987 RepID=A0AAE2ZPS4_9HYPH|nr:amino acid dehydrogenase [Flavimaribacter sediminis]
MTMEDFRQEFLADHPDFDNHEQVVFRRLPEFGVDVIIAIHNTVLGPALGGARLWKYPTKAAALTDVLRLSSGMTCKNALAGLEFGGGKAVVIADPQRDKSPALLRAFARTVNDLEGRYISGEDVGLTPPDMDILAEVTPYVRGGTKGPAGDPSPFTALGVFEGMKEARRFKFDDERIAGLTVSIQGLGNVGWRVAEMLHEAGAKLVVSDIRGDRVKEAETAFGATAVDPEKSHRVEADIYAPCALGAIINDETVDEIAAPIVAGSANNQLAASYHGQLLAERDILFAPDYVLNAGGVICLARQDETGPEIESRVRSIARTLRKIFETAARENLPTSMVAGQMARSRLKHRAG